VGVAERVSSKERPAVLARAAAVLAGVLVLDQLTKHTVAAGIGEGEVRRFLPAVNLVHVRNKGIAFGVLAGGGPIVLVITLAVLLGLAVYLARRPDRQGLWLACGLLVGGALGNLVDRVASGEVIDFIKLPLWPAFNVADIAITFGVLALLWVFEGPREHAG
jgi:signal peptidase II